MPERVTTDPGGDQGPAIHKEPAPESPSADGAYGAREAADYHPAPQSGARPVEVPEPEEVRRPSFEHSDAPDEDGNPLDSDRGAPTNERWRHPHSRGENEER